MKKKMKNENEKVIKSSIVDKVKEMQEILNDVDIINKKTINEARQKKILETQEQEPLTTVRDLTKEDSILKEYDNKKKKTFTEDDLKESLLNFSFTHDVMNKFNSLINEEAKEFLDKTKKAEEWIEDDDNPNIFIKLTIIEDRDRMLFKELLFSTSERRRPIYVNFGDYDFFFEYFDNDQPVFSFNKKNFTFFFDSDLNKLKTHIKGNKCAFGGYSFLASERSIKFDNIIVEILNKKEKVQEEIQEKVQEEIQEQEIQEKVQETKIKVMEFEVSNYKKVYKVKTEKDTLFILTNKPGDIFEKIDGVLSVKVMGFGIQLDNDISS